MSVCSHSPGALKEYRLAEGPYHSVRQCKDCGQFIAWVTKSDSPMTRESIMTRLRILAAGPFFPPKPFGNDGRIWSDEAFINEMLALDGGWSDRQEALILKKIDHYDKYGRQLYKKAAPAPEQPKLGTDPLGEIPF